jgi:hypothetical protein
MKYQIQCKLCGASEQERKEISNCENLKPAAISDGFDMSTVNLPFAEKISQAKVMQKSNSQFFNISFVL